MNRILDGDIRKRDNSSQPDIPAALSRKVTNSGKPRSVSRGNTMAFVSQPFEVPASSLKSRRGITRTTPGRCCHHPARLGWNMDGCGRSTLLPTSERDWPRLGMNAGGEDHHQSEEEERIELAAEVVGAVTKAAFGVAVNRAAATVSENKGIQPRGRPVASGAKRKALPGLLSNLVTFLRSNEASPGRRQTRDVVTKVKSPHRLKPSSSSTSKEGEAATGVMVNGYWFPSLEASAEAPASNGFDFSKAAEVAASTERERQERVGAERRRRACAARGVDFSCGAVLLSAPTPFDAPEVSGDAVAAELGTRTTQPLWQRLAMSVSERMGLVARIQQAVKDSVPRMPRETLLLVVSVAGGELAKREIAAQVEALEEPVRGPAWALLNETYRNVELLGSELVQSNWDVASLLTRELADWKRRGVGNSNLEALLKEVIQLQTRALLRPITLPADEGSLILQLNATYKSIEESIGKFLPRQTKEQLSLLEALVRKLEEKGIGELSFDEVYRALLLGAVPPTLVTDAVRLLSAGRPGEGGGAGFLTVEAPGYYGRESAGNVTLASLAARLNDTQALTRVITYTALAAETEVIESVREVLDGLQSNIRKSLLDMESELMQQSAPPAQPSPWQGTASYINHVARSAVTFAINSFNAASKAFDASFEALAEPSRRTLVRSSELFPWHNTWNNFTREKEDKNTIVRVGVDSSPLSLNPTPEHPAGGVNVSKALESHSFGADTVDAAGQAPTRHEHDEGGNRFEAGESGSAPRSRRVEKLPSERIAGVRRRKSSRRRTPEAEDETHLPSPSAGARDAGACYVSRLGSSDIDGFGSDTAAGKRSARPERRRRGGLWSGDYEPLSARPLDEDVPGEGRTGGVSGAEGFGRRRWRG